MIIRINYRLSEVFNEGLQASKEACCCFGWRIGADHAGVAGIESDQLAALSGIPQTTISAIENDRVRLGVERAKVLARALRCHPAVLVFPGWEHEVELAA